jgi:hypothetical protein
MAAYVNKFAVEQITKADRNACHALCKKANPAPRYGGLVPPFHVPKYVEKKVRGELILNAVLYVEAE